MKIEYYSIYFNISIMYEILKNVVIFIGFSISHYYNHLWNKIFYKIMNNDEIPMILFSILIFAIIGPTGSHIFHIKFDIDNDKPDKFIYITPFVGFILYYLIFE